ncbi:MAG: DHHW family protein [Ruminococcus sp.]|nr:DHHW family protein [Ruminococcus sp.]
MKKSKKRLRAEKEMAAQKVYRERHAIYQRVWIVLFLSVIFFAGLCLALINRPTVSERENRELTQKPELTPDSYFSGEFADEYTKYFSDTVPLRDTFLDLSAAFNKLKGIDSPTFYGDVAVVADDQGKSVETEPPGSEPIQTEPAAPGDGPRVITRPEDETDVTQPPVTEAVTETEEEEEVKDIAEFSHNGIVTNSVKMYGDNAGVMLFGGSKTCGTRYAELISDYKRALGDDINVYNMVVPTSAEFYLPKKFARFSASEKDSIDHIYSSYTADVIPIDAYSEIAAHTDEYIYLRTDHHWSQRGAYYAYVALCKAIGQTPPDIDNDDDYETLTKDGFVGSLYGYTNDETLKNSPEIFTYYKPRSEYTTYYYDYKTLESKGEGKLFYENVSGGNCYAMYLGADAVHTKIVTGLDTGRRICVFKESYGNAFIPFLVDSFDEIYVIDIRYFGRNAVEYIKEMGITDVLFLNNAFAANTNSLIDGIEYMYTYDYGTLDSEQVAEVRQYLSTMTTAAPDEDESTAQ